MQYIITLHCVCTPDYKFCHFRNLNCKSTISKATAEHGMGNTSGNSTKEFLKHYCLFSICAKAASHVC